jgi:hypothetical protein
MQSEGKGVAMIDVILMGADVYGLFEKEMNATDHCPSEGGFLLHYDFNGVPCHYARIPRDQVRFVSEDKVATRIFDPNRDGIFHFLKLYMGAMNAALKAIAKENS